MEQKELLTYVIGIFTLPIIGYLAWCGQMESFRPWIKQRKSWLFQKFSVNLKEPLYILADGRKILQKYVSSDDEICVFVEKNWQLCKYDRQEFDRMLFSRKKRSYYYSTSCVIVSKDYKNFGVFNTELKKLVVPVEYRYDQLRFDEEKGIYIKIAPYADRAFTYQGESIHPW